MKNRKFVLGMLALALIFGLMVIGCPEPSDPLNGVWAQANGSTIKFNNGEFQEPGDAPFMYRGTYSTSGTQLTMIVTHYIGSFFNMTLQVDVFTSHLWYSKSEFLSLIATNSIELGAFSVDDMYASFSSTYSISGNTLNITSVYGVIITYTKQ